MAKEQQRKKSRFVSMSGGQGDDMLGLVDSMIDGKVAVEGGMKLKDLTQEIGSLFSPSSRAKDPVAPAPTPDTAKQLTPAEPAPEMATPGADDPIGAAEKAEKDSASNLFKKIIKAVGGMF